MTLSFATPNSKDSATEALKIPPYSIEAEQAALGGLMLDNSTWDQIADRISDEDFYQVLGNTWINHLGLG